MPAVTIDEVIRQLESIVEEASAAGDPLGIFAVVYLGVTRDVKSGIDSGKFEDGARMARLDVIFANRYLDALALYRNSEPCTRSWEIAFEAAQNQDFLILQHLLLGMNAHINLDLGIAAAESVEPNRISELERDFMSINRVLSEKIDEVQDRLSRVSPLLFLLDWAGQRKDEQFAEFSLIQARNQAWQSALNLAKGDAGQQASAIQDLDALVAALGRLISHPGKWIGWLLKLIRLFEKKDVRQVMALLR
ncbi:MAG TPA: DUF5995 family protein [Saprospiraceae bacterium]|nr:DUF5995 family protein [Saprospiraceae bacterium]HRK81646.1 DUF5995 family protein [Saprospiraceae bacterium]